MSAASNDTSRIAQGVMKQPRGTWRHFRHKTAGASENGNVGPDTGIDLPALGQRQCQFASGSTATNDRDAPRIALTDKPVQPVPKPADRLDRNGMGCGPLYGTKIRTAANIDGQHVKADGRPVGKQDALAIRVNGCCFGMDEACLGHSRQPHKIYMDILFRPYALDKGRQHTGIGGVDVTAYESQAQARQWMHGKVLECGNLRMATAKQHQFTADGHITLHQEAKALS